MDVVGADEPTADVMARVLLSTDLVSHILLHYACAHTKGWNLPLAVTREVCTTWRDALAAVVVWISEWHESEWTIRQVSKVPIGDKVVVASATDTPHARLRCYNWDLTLYPRLVIHKVWHGQSMHSEALWEWDGMARYTRHEVIGAFVRVPAADELPDLWARRVECVLTLCHPTDVKLNSNRYFRHRFHGESKDWGYPDDEPANSFGSLCELRARGFLGTDDTLRFQARVRVHPGRLACSSEKVVHALSRADGLKEHVERCSMLPISFYCDLCNTTLPTGRLHRCTQGCNFDICDECIDPVLHRLI